MLFGNEQLAYFVTV